MVAIKESEYLDVQRTLLTILLLLSIIPLSFPQQGVSGQALASTTTVTLTDVKVSTASTVQVGVTVTETLSYSDANFYPPSTIMLGIGGTNYCAYYAHLKFYAVTSQRVFGQLSANLPIYFYVMNPTQYNDWVNLKACKVSEALIRSEGTRSYSLDWSAPQDGYYYLVFLNENNNSATVSFAPQTNSVVTQDYTIYSISTETSTHMQTYRTAFVAINQTSFMLLILLGVILASIEVVRIRRSSPTTRRGRSCPNCGRKNPIDTNFCGNCATELRPGKDRGRTRDEVQPY